MKLTIRLLLVNVGEKQLLMGMFRAQTIALVRVDIAKDLVVEYLEQYCFCAASFQTCTHHTRPYHISPGD